MTVSIDRRPSGTGEIVAVTFDRRAKLNALDSASIAELSEAFAGLAGDDAVRAVVLTGAGDRAFVGGADISELNGLTVESARAFITRLHELFRAIRAFPAPVIARVNGYSLGAGMELAAACDMRVASDNAVFGMPEVRVGLPSVIEAALLPRLVGWGRANYLVLTGETIDAATAHEWGLVESPPVPLSELDAATAKVAEAIAAAGPLAVRAQKRLVGEWERLPLEDAIRAGIDSLAAAFETDEPRRMTRPFLERKKRG